MHNQTQVRPASDADAVRRRRVVHQRQHQSHPGAHSAGVVPLHTYNHTLPDSVLYGI